MWRSGVIAGCLLVAGTARAEPAPCAPPAEWTHALRTATHVVVADRTAFHQRQTSLLGEWKRSWEATYVIERVLLGTVADKQFTLKVSCTGPAATSEDDCLTPPAGQDLVLFLKKTRSGWQLAQRAAGEPCPPEAEVKAAGAKNVALFDDLAKLAAVAEESAAARRKSPFGIKPRPSATSAATTVPSAASSSEKPARPREKRRASEPAADGEEPTSACACATPPRHSRAGFVWLLAPLALLATRRR